MRYAKWYQQIIGELYAIKGKKSSSIQGFANRETKRLPRARCME
jgi:hypothetical protein